METIGRHKPKEIISVRIEQGECLRGKIESAMKEVGGSAIVISAFGSLSKVVFSNPASIDKQHRKTDKKELEGPFEIVSLMGAVGSASAHKDRMSHIHIAVSRHDGPVQGGGLGYGSEAWFPINVHLVVYE